MFTKIVDSIDREYIHSITKELSLMGNKDGEYGFRVSGSTGEWSVSNRISEEMKKIGLSDVKQETFPVESWEFLSGSLTVDDEEMPMTSYCGVVGTPNEGITADVVYVGNGSAEYYDGNDVKDKICLCEFDILNDYWISVAAYEAETRGAAALVISYTGDMYGTREDAVNCFDSQCHYGFPVGNISRRNGSLLKEKIKKSSVTACFKLNIEMDIENGKSSNVIGLIPGEDHSQAIMMGGHMDGYFHSYQDDLLGVGIVMGIAKAMIESGYKPKHDIIIIAHGSEEYGKINSRYDWCLGSWSNINLNHPEWFGKVICFMNIDAIRPGTPVYNVASTPEYHDFFRNFMEEMQQVPESSWPGGKALIGLNGPWDDGFNYAIKGVPTVICGRGPAEWSYQNYHTQYDNYTIYDEEHEIIEYVAAMYAEMAVKFDEFALPPLNFATPLRDAMITLENAVDVIEEKKAKKLITKLDKGIELSNRLYEGILKANQNGEVKNAEITRKTVMECYRKVQGDFMKLGPWDDVVFAHECPVSNIRCIESAKLSIEAGDFEKAKNDMWNFDLFNIAYQFSPEVYDWLMECQDFTRTDLYWGTGKIHKFAELKNIAGKIKSEDREASKTELDKLLAFEKALLDDIIEREIAIIGSLNDDLEKISIQ